MKSRVSKDIFSEKCSDRCINDTYLMYLFNHASHPDDFIMRDHILFTVSSFKSDEHLF